MIQKQFSRIIKMMINDGTKASIQIKHILTTGEIPTDDADARMLEMFGKMLAMMQAVSLATTSDTSSENDGI